MGKRTSGLLRYPLNPKGYIDPIEKGLHGDLQPPLTTSIAVLNFGKLISCKFGLRPYRAHVRHFASDACEYKF